MAANLDQKMSKYLNSVFRRVNTVFQFHIDTVLVIRENFTKNLNFKNSQLKTLNNFS